VSILKVNRLSYNFGSNWALKDISFSLEKGDYLYVTGPSGAGKTTLLRLIFGLLPVTRGKAEVCGFTMNGIHRSALPLLRRQVSFVFQDFKILPHRTVAENVALALQARLMPEQQVRKRVRAVLRGLEGPIGAHGTQGGYPLRGPFRRRATTRGRGASRGHEPATASRR